MQTARNLVVFVRAPRLGTVKRRLAADIGAVAARRFYARTMADLLARVGRDPRWKTWLAVTPDSFAARGRFWPRDIERFPQGEGDLGARMARAMARFTGEAVAIVGSDIPALDASHIADGFAKLGGSELVFGPASDGGYWLVGARDGECAGELFAGVRWSTGHALADTLANAGASAGASAGGRSFALLEELDDVDDGADLARIKGRLFSVP
jgi:rSAM/selenodomain-associated transferase 1